MHYISQFKTRIVEGELRCKELRAYLEKINSKMNVWLCEDGSGINTKVELDPLTNQIVGIVLPFNSENGMPISFTFLADSAEKMRKHMEERTSTHVYIVLAQPLIQNAPPFILQIFGTDNKFTAQNVLQRWNWTAAELKKWVKE